MTDKIIKVDPRVHLDELKKIEFDIVSKINDLERKIKLQLLELQTTRDLIKEITDSVTQQEVGEFKEASKKIEENIQKLEEVVEDFEVKKEHMGLEDQPYMLNKEGLDMVTSYSTIERLYTLADKKDWSPEEAKEFAGIKYNMNKALKEDFNSIISNRLEKVYDAVKAVNVAKPEAVKYEVGEEFIGNVSTLDNIKYE